MSKTLDLFKNDPELAALAKAFDGPRKWGNIWYEYEQAQMAKLSEKEREKLEKARKNKLSAFMKMGEEATLEKRISENIAKKQREYTNNSGALRKIKKKCRWECKGEKCWAHSAKTCPFIHKGQPGWDEKSAVPLPSAAAGAGAGTGKKGRLQTRRRRSNRNQTMRRRQ